MNLEKLNELLDSLSAEISECKENLYEFATKQAKVKERINDKSDIVVEHIIKCIQYGYQNSETLHHWCAEIFANLKNVVYLVIKGTGKTPNKKQLKEWLFTEYYESIYAIQAVDNYWKEEYSNPQYTDIYDLYEATEFVVDKLIELIINKKLTLSNIQKLF